VTLPEYRHPPVKEVVLGVHFDALSRLGGPHIGLLWQEFRSLYGKVEEASPLVFHVERFGLGVPPDPPRIELIDSISPRIWLVNESETELLQIQQDWFSHNWRKLNASDEYPRYSKIQHSFRKELQQFVAFIEREHLGSFSPVQCEVTYVNLIPLDSHASLGNVLTIYQPNFGDDFLPEPETVNLAVRFIIPKGDSPIGRLHVVATPVIVLESNSPALQLTLTARGNPGGANLDAVFAFLDLGHEWIVRAFTSITTSTMHDKWERTQ
jgi:uncharacterized protein (TIGR04255 family)